MVDLISRQAAIDVVDSETVSTNPEHFKSSEKFIKFMDDSDISSFGKWQWSNGFNTALVATRIHLKKLPSAQLATDTNVGDTISRKGVFIPDITVEMFRNASLEGVEDLMASGEMEDISLPSAQPEIIRCKDCRHNHDCNIQYHAQAGEEFYCGVAERRIDGKNQN